MDNKKRFNILNIFRSRDSKTSNNAESILTPTPDDLKKSTIINGTDLSGFSDTHLNLFGASTYSNWINNVETTKNGKLELYRQMERYPYIDDAIDEILTEAINVDDNGNIIKIDIKRDFNSNQQSNLNKEWDYIIELMDLETNMMSWFRDYIVTGEFALENIIDSDSIDSGIQDVKFLQAEKYIVEYNDSGEIDKFIIKNPYNSQERIPVSHSHLSYINTGKFDYIEQKKTSQHSTYTNGNVEDVTRDKVVLSSLEKVKKVYKQLDALEDSMIVYRLARAPERLVFNVDTGSLPKTKADTYMRKIMDKFRRKTTYDPQTGNITKQQNSVALVEDMWFPKSSDGRGTDVTTIGGDGSGLGEMTEVIFFLQKLYRSLKIPYTRMPYASTDGDPTSSSADFSNGQVGSVTRDEIKFEMYIRQQLNRFTIAIKHCFMNHLKLKGIWDEYDMDASDFKLSCVPSMYFTTQKETDKLNIMFERFEHYSNYFDEFISKEMICKEILEWSDEKWDKNLELWKQEKEIFKDDDY